MPPSSLSAIIPDGDVIDADLFEREITAVLIGEVRAITDLYNDFASTWRGAKPSMRKEIVIGSEAYGEVSADGDTEGNKKLLWLDDGTSERWALMSPDWQSKTSPRQTQSRSGRGSVVVRGRSRMRKPQPGIEARNISDTIAKEREERFQRAVENAVARAARGK